MKNNLGNQGKTGGNKQKEKISDSNQKTFEEISAENEYLGKRVVALLENMKTTEDKAECRRKNENSGAKETIVAGLRSQIEQLKKEVVEKDETIDFLVEERDDRSQHIIKLRLKLADAWHITFPDDADKIREVARLEDTDENPKSYCEAARGMTKEIDEPKRTNEVTTDSGIDVQSLHKLIAERVAVSLDAK